VRIICRKKKTAELRTERSGDSQGRHRPEDRHIIAQLIDVNPKLG
jgi:hypothetical protein